MKRIRTLGSALFLTAAGLFLTAAALAAQTAKPANGGTAAAKPSPKPDPAFTALTEKAANAREAGNTDSAIPLYVEALGRQPNWSEGWWSLGTLYYESDQYTQARDAFRHLTSNEPKMAVAWGMLGLCEFETKQYPQSMQHLQRGYDLGLASHPDIADVVDYHRALLMTRAGDFEQGMGLIALAVGKGKESDSLVEAMGIAALRKPVLPSELPPTERELVMQVGHALCNASARRYADAVAEMQALLKRYPTMPELHFLTGLALLSSDPDAAIEMMKEELAISPRHAQAYFSIAKEYDKRSDFVNALPFAEKAVETNPNFAPAHALLGKILVDGGADTKRGMAEIQRAIALAPRAPQNHFLLAKAYAKAGRSEDAARERAEFMRLRAETPLPEEKQ